VWMAIYVMFFESTDIARTFEKFREVIGWWARLVGTAVVCLTLLNVGIRAALSISGERERQTFDALLTSPLASDEILFGKWLGSIFGARGGWMWAASIFAVGVSSRGIQLVAVPFLLLAWLIYAAFMAGMGLWFSLYCRTSMRAVLATVAAAFIISFGHWLLWMCGIPLAILGIHSRWLDKLVETAALYQTFGQTPPVTLGMLAFQSWEFRDLGSDVFGLPVSSLMIFFAFLGVALCGLEAAIWWDLALRRFIRLYRPRLAGPQPKPPAPSAASTSV